MKLRQPMLILTKGLLMNEELSLVNCPLHPAEAVSLNRNEEWNIFSLIPSSNPWGPPGVAHAAGLGELPQNGTY